MLHLTLPILAISDPLVLGMWAINLIVSISLGIGLFALKGGQDARRTELAGMGDKIDSLEERLHTANNAKIDARLSDIAHKLNGHAQGLTSTMDKLALGIKESDKRIGEAEKDLIRTASQIKQSVHECAPSREEFDDVKVIVGELSRAVQSNTHNKISLNDMSRMLAEAVRMNSEASRAIGGNRNG